MVVMVSSDIMGELRVMVGCGVGMSFVFVF